MTALTKQTSKTVGSFLEAQKSQIQAVIPKHVNADRLMRVALQAIQNSPQLAGCTSSSLFTSIVRSSMMGLELNGSLGEAYLVSYGQEATLQIGYRGLIILARRSGIVTDIFAHCVHENDEFEYVLGTDPRIIHKPTMNDRGAIIGVYAVFKTIDGGKDFEYMSLEEVKGIQATSKSGKKPSSPWMKYFGEMAKKTVIRRLSKRMPMSVEMAQAVEIDNKTSMGEVVNHREEVINVEGIVIPEDVDPNQQIAEEADPTRS